MEPTADLLLRYLDSRRSAIFWKLAGLTERELRLPRTPTGSNLLGIVKHLALVEIGYIELAGRPSGYTFREYDDDAPPNEDMYARAEESAADVARLYQEAGRLTRAAVAETPLETPVHVPWWGAKAETTFGRVLVHLLSETAQHSGHIDILRELADAEVGLLEDASNVPDEWAQADWESYVARLESIADSFGEDGPVLRFS